MSSEMRTREFGQREAPWLGAWATIPDPFSAELLGRAGFDYVVLDCQHGLIGFEAMVPMLQALALTDVTRFVRVASNQAWEIMRALDAGAHGVIVPLVDSADDARRAVEACRYPPTGTRSWGPIRAALGRQYSTRLANEQVLCLVMIETVDGVANLREIVSVPGVDGVYIGPSDLALSHGRPPTFDVQDSEHLQLVELILATCLAAGSRVGIHCPNVDVAKRWVTHGFHMLTVVSDSLLLSTQSREVLSTLRARRD